VCTIEQPSPRRARQADLRSVKGVPDCVSRLDGEVNEMESSRCRMVAIEINDPRCSSLLAGVTIEAEDSRCRSLVEGLVLEVDDARCRHVAIRLEDPRCRNLHMMWSLRT
jgi:hypothetical protein